MNFTTTKMNSTTDNVDSVQSEIKIDLLVNMIPKFDGNKINFYDFLDNCDLADSLAKSSSKHTLLTFIKSKIVGNARAQIRNREFEYWSELRSHLVETYSDKRSHAQWQLELSLCKQEPRENIVSYSQRIENCLVRLTNSLDPNLTLAERKANVKLLRSQALTIFLMGLNKDLSIVVKSQRPQSLEDAISLAQAEEKEQQARREIDRHSNPSHFRQNNTNYPKYSGYNSSKPQLSNFNSKPQQQRTFFSHSMSLNPTPKPSFHSPMQTPPKQCRYCKNLGHTIDECRKRQYNNAMRNQNTSYKPTDITKNPPNTTSRGFQHSNQKNVQKNV